MRKRIILLSLVFVLLCGCGASPSVPQEDKLTIVATTYPIYVFACALTEGVEGVEVERLNTGSVSCLHDYTLSMSDMKKLEKADVIAMNGAELESFLEDALATSDAAVIDCSEGIELLENLSHHHVEEEEEHTHSEEEEHLHEEDEVHDHAGEEEHVHEDEHDHEEEEPALDDHGHDHGHWDPHYWLDPENASKMIWNLAEQLTVLDQENLHVYDSNRLSATARLHACDVEMRNILFESRADISGLITFHDGFQYFAHAFGLPLLEAIEEEAGSEASAKEIVEITGLVKEHHIPVIFTEYNGSDATAKAISRETGCQVAQLSMIMDGEDDRLESYINAQINNMKAVCGGFAKEAAAQ